MKHLAIPALLAVLAVATLSGCVAVPYDQAYSIYPPQPVYGYAPQPYEVVPQYAVPGPVYGPPVYIGPPVHFSFGLGYWSGGGGHHDHHFGGDGHHHLDGGQRHWRH